MSHLRPEDRNAAEEADWNRLRSTSTRPSWWVRWTGRTRPSHRLPLWPAALLLLVALGLLAAGAIAGGSTTTSNSSSVQLVLEEIEGPGLFLFVGGILTSGFSFLFLTFKTGISKDTLIFPILGLATIGLGVLVILTTSLSETVTVDSSVGTITVVEVHLFRTTTKQTDLDQVERVHYRYIPPRGEDRAFAIVSLILNDESSVEIHRGEPETMEGWARGIANQAGLQMTAGR